MNRANVISIKRMKMLQQRKNFSTKSRILAIICQLSLSIGQSRSFYNKNYLNAAIQHLQDYNQINVKDVGFLLSPQFYTEDSNFFQDLHDINSQVQESVRFFTTFRATSNTVELADKIELFDASSVIIVPEFESLKEVRDAFFRLPGRLTRNKMWLFFCASNFSRTEDMTKHVNNVLSQHSNYHSKFSIDSQVYAVGIVKNVPQLIELYRVCPDRNISINQLTTLRLQNHILQKYIWEQRKNLDHCTIKVGWMDYAKDVEKLENVSESKDSVNSTKQIQSRRMLINTGGLTLKGYSAQRFSLLHSTLNFSIKWVHVDDLKFGSRENDSWTGIVGMLQQGKIDTAILELSITAERKKVISYAPPSQPYRTYLFSLKPGPTWPWTTFLSVFDTVYWAMLIIFVIAFALILQGMLLCSEKSENTKIPFINQMSNCIGFLSQSLRAFAALDVTNSYDDLSTRKHSKRVLVLVICFCGALNFYVYNAGLISYLMVQENPLLINQLSDIAKNPEYNLLVNSGSSDEGFLRNSKNAEYRKILTKSEKENGMFSSYEAGETTLLERNNMVLFGESPTFEVMADSFPCQVVRSKQRYNFNYAAFPFPNESPYIPLFTYAVNKMMENGLMMQRWDKEKETMECEDPTSKYFRTLSYKDVISAFSIFFVGCFIAFGYCMIEWIYNIFTFMRRREWAKKDLQNHYLKFHMVRQKVQVLITEMEKECETISYLSKSEENSEIKQMLYEISRGYQRIIDSLK